jgi:hypothetical protein
MSNKMLRTIVALCVCAVSALIAWAGGYNFDQRSPGVAVWVLATVTVAFLAAIYPGLDEESK